MQNYFWANTSWGTDVLTYTTFKYLGFLGITLLGELVITLTFFFFSKAASLSFWDQAVIFPLLIFLEEPVNSASFRAQLMSLLFLGILYFILSRFDRKSIFRFLPIPLFLIWANMHGGFILGLLIFLLWIFVKFVQSKSLSLVKSQFSIFLASLAATLINPFGLGAYAEVLHHFASEWQKHIIEWTPLDVYSDLWWRHLLVGALILFSTMYLTRNKKMKNIMPFAVIPLVVFILPFFARRYAWPFYYLTLPLLKILADFLFPKSKNLKLIIPLAIFLIYLTFSFKKIDATFKVITSGFPLDKFNKIAWEVYCRSFSDCSPKAAQYLIQNNLTDNLMTFYDWGGWLIWNYPEIKPSIDGRMPSWQDDKGHSAFNEYYLIEQNKKDIDKTVFNVVLMSPRKPVYYRLLQLVSAGSWKLVYKDKVSGIFIRSDERK